MTRSSPGVRQVRNHPGAVAQMIRPPGDGSQTVAMLPTRVQSLNPRGMPVIHETPPAWSAQAGGVSLGGHVSVWPWRNPGMPTMGLAGAKRPATGTGGLLLRVEQVRNVNGASLRPLTGCVRGHPRGCPTR